jgi:3-oxoacyl-[acyl-carrier protein] reductase
LIEGTSLAQRIPEAVVQQTRSQVVLGRVASAQDIAAQVVTFCRAESITGQVLVIDGGMPGSMH